jgi:hypothetical protein
MDIYMSTLILGLIGMTVMAVGGVGRHGRGGHHARGRHAPQPRGSHGAAAASGLTHALALLTSPRVLFSVMIGFGAAGQAFKGDVPPWTLPLIALLGGILFERIIVTPIWNFALRFASNPAMTLDHALADEATAVTAFDANGEGIISLEIDGQIVQLLGRLQKADHRPGSRVRAGQKLRVEDVNPAHNSCTVSLADR